MASSDRLYMDSSGCLKRNSSNPSTAPVVTSITDNVRASERILSSFPTPMDLPIMTAEDEDRAITITFRYWKKVVATELAAMASADKCPRIAVCIGTEMDQTTEDNKIGAATQA